MPKKVILIMTDSQRRDMVGCYGSPFVTQSQPTPTPNLDRLAEGGLRFNRAYTVSPVCGPSRSAIFTGNYPHENGIWANSMALYSNVHSVGERLSDEGLHTAYIGKWHLGRQRLLRHGQMPAGAGMKNTGTTCAITLKNSRMMTASDRANHPPAAIQT